MKNYKSKSKYFLLTILMGCKVVLATSVSNLIDQNQVHKPSLNTLVSNYSQSTIDQNSIQQTSKSDHTVSISHLDSSKTTDRDWELRSSTLNRNNEISEEYECQNEDNLISSITLVIDRQKNLFKYMKCYLNIYSGNCFPDLEKKLNVSIDKSNPVVRLAKKNRNIEFDLTFLHQINAIPDSIMSQIQELTNLDFVEKSRD